MSNLFLERQNQNLSWFIQSPIDGFADLLPITTIEPIYGVTGSLSIATAMNQNLSWFI